MRRSLSTTSLTALATACAIVLTAEAVGNVSINRAAKGAWDIYAAAELAWVGCSVLAIVLCGRGQSLAGIVVALLFLDAFADKCAMGQRCWWAGPPVMVEWRWGLLSEQHRLNSLIWAYWVFTWMMQVPLRCFVMARVVSPNWGRSFLVIALGLNVIWFTAPQDVIYYFVWWGRYSAAEPYFSYLPPAGFWNLWNMLLLRVPIGVGVGAMLVRAGMRDQRDLMSNVLIAVALGAIAVYAVVCIWAVVRM